jgi:cell division protein FtsQ
MSSSRAATPAGRTRKTTRSRGATTAKPKPKARTKAPAKPKPKAKAAPRRRPKATRSAPPRRPAPRRAAPKRKRPRRSPLAWTRDQISGVSWRYRLATIAILAVTGAAGYFLWLRDSSLVAIDNVDVVGVTAGERSQIIGQLTDASESMTTLHVDRAKLESIAKQFPTVASISIDPNFPHGMRIEVTERPPTMVLTSGDQQVPVAADGTVLAGVQVADDEHLPTLEVDKLPTTARLSGTELDEALVVGAAPEELRPLIEKVELTKEFGVQLTLRGGIPVRFGAGAAAREKWSAVAAVLADPKLTTLTYVDVRVPERPAVGGANTSAVSDDPQL